MLRCTKIGEHARQNYEYLLLTSLRLITVYLRQGPIAPYSNCVICSGSTTVVNDQHFYHNY